MENILMVTESQGIFMNLQHVSNLVVTPLPKKHLDDLSDDCNPQPLLPLPVNDNQVKKEVHDFSVAAKRDMVSVYFLL